MQEDPQARLDKIKRILDGITEEDIIWFDKPLSPEEIELDAKAEADAAAIAAEWGVD